MWGIHLALFVTCCTLAVCQMLDQTTTSIDTSTGLIRGEILATAENLMIYSSFKGIPYGEPPLGRRRFRPPLPKKPWTDVLFAFKEGPKCIQRDFIYNNFTGDEDCLYLNIYTPQVDFDFDETFQFRPVIFWIHGGSFYTGYSNSYLYGPDYFIERNIVVVTINYRLGALGFLSLDHADATGNAGLKDQNLALRWVKENIINFGGDPNKITIAGQGAGGSSVDFHVLSEMSKGLFQNSISMSGSPLCLWSFVRPDEAVNTAFKLGRSLGIWTIWKESLLLELYDLPAIDIVKAAQDMTVAFSPFRPTIENEDLSKNEEKFLTECTVKRYNEGNFYKAPHLMGFMNEETLAFGGSASKQLEMQNATMDKIKSYLPDFTISTEVVNGLAGVSESIVRGIVDATTDILFKTGIDSKQKKLSEKNNFPIYYYNIKYSPRYSLHRELGGVDLDGPANADDLLYLFYSTVVKPPPNAMDPINMFRYRMLRLWTNFIEFGNPTPSVDDVLNVVWPDSRKDGHHLEIGVNLTVGHRPTDLHVKLYELAGLGTSRTINGCEGLIARILG